MPLRQCLGRCGQLTERRDSRCPACASARNRSKDAQRGSRHERGYDASHMAAREAWKPKVQTGLIACARCAQPIQPGQEWALDHTDDRTGYLGPSHATCNNSAGGRAAHQT